MTEQIDCAADQLTSKHKGLSPTFIDPKDLLIDVFQALSFGSQSLCRLTVLQTNLDRIIKGLCRAFIDPKNLLDDGIQAPSFGNQFLLVTGR